jgi:hypothetical protein
MDLVRADERSTASQVLVLHRLLGSGAPSVQLQRFIQRDALTQVLEFGRLDAAANCDRSQRLIAITSMRLLVVVGSATEHLLAAGLAYQCRPTAGSWIPDTRRP